MLLIISIWRILSGMKINPTHQNFYISEEIMTSNSQMIIKMNAEFWMTMKCHEELLSIAKAKDKIIKKANKKEKKKANIDENTKDFEKDLFTQKGLGPSDSSNLFTPTTSAYVKHTVAKLFSGGLCNDHFNHWILNISDIRVPILLSINVVKSTLLFAFDHQERSHLFSFLFYRVLFAPLSFPPLLPFPPLLFFLPSSYRSMVLLFLPPLSFLHSLPLPSTLLSPPFSSILFSSLLSPHLISLLFYSSTLLYSSPFLSSLFFSSRLLSSRLLSSPLSSRLLSSPLLSSPFLSSPLLSSPLLFSIIVPKDLN